MSETLIATPEWIALTVVAWLATYIVHSTLLILTVWGFTRWCSLDSLTRSLLWKLALVGGLFTATLQTGLGVRPWLGQVAVASEEEEAAAQAGRWEVRTPRVLLRRALALQVGHVPGDAELELAGALMEARAEALEAEAEALEAAAEQLEVGVEGSEESDAAQAERDAAQAERDAAQAERDAAQAERDAAQAERDAAEAERDAAVASWDAFAAAQAGERSAGFMVFTGPSSDCRGPACPWVHVETDSFEVPAVAATGTPTDGPTRGPWEVLAGLFVAGMVLSLGRLVWLASRLRGVLRGREALTDGALRERLMRLMARARVSSAQVRLTLSPVLRSPIALASREIVVPTRALCLDARQQEAMLAHELAHVVRRDPAWLVLAAVIEAALFIQPLNRVARRGMQEAAEELSDDWAVRHIGDGLHLARCLAEVAGWLERGHNDEMFVSPMASESGSILVRRVRRLLDAGPRRGLAVHWRLLMAAGLLCVAGFGAPGFAPSLAQAKDAAPVIAAAPVAPPAPPAPPMAAMPPAPPMAPMAAMPPAPPMAAMPPLAMMAPVAPRALIVPAATRGSAPVVVVNSAQPVVKPTLRQRRLERRADRLEQRANKQAARAGALRERSGVGPSTCPDPDPGEPHGPERDAVARALAEAARHGAAQISVIDRAALEREIAEGLRDLPDADEVRRAIEDGLRALPDARALEAEIAASLRGLPDAEEIEAALAEGLRELPSQAEIERELAAGLDELPAAERAAIEKQVKDALRSLPSKQQIERQVKDAMRSVPSKRQIERQVRDAMRGVPDRRQIERQVEDALRSLPSKEQIEKQVRDSLREVPERSATERGRKQADREAKAAERARAQAERARRRGR